jgi:hypothetical protein
MWHAWHGISGKRDTGKFLVVNTGKLVTEESLRSVALRTRAACSLRRVKRPIACLGRRGIVHKARLRRRGDAWDMIPPWLFPWPRVVKLDLGKNKRVRPLSVRTIPGTWMTENCHFLSSLDETLSQTLSSTSTSCMPLCNVGGGQYMCDHRPQNERQYRHFPMPPIGHPSAPGMTRYQCAVLAATRVRAVTSHRGASLSVFASCVNSA